MTFHSFRNIGLYFNNVRDFHFAVRRKCNFWSSSQHLVLCLLEPYKAKKAKHKGQASLTTKLKINGAVTNKRHRWGTPNAAHGLLFTMLVHLRIWCALSGSAACFDLWLFYSTQLPENHQGRG